MRYLDTCTAGTTCREKPQYECFSVNTLVAGAIIFSSPMQHGGNPIILLHRVYNINFNVSIKRHGDYRNPQPPSCTHSCMLKSLYWLPVEWRFIFKTCNHRKNTWKTYTTSGGPNRIHVYMYMGISRICTSSGSCFLIHTVRDFRY